MASGVNAVVSATVNEGKGSVSGVSSRQRVRIVQKDGTTEVTEEYDDESVPEPKGER